jgi:hypothetical protein
VLIRHGIRVVHRLRVETGNLPLAKFACRRRPAPSSWLWEYRIELANVREAGGHWR